MFGRYPNNPPQVNFSGGSSTGVNGNISVPVSNNTSVWASGGQSMPVAHPSVPTGSPAEKQGSVGVSFRFGQGK